MPRLSRWAVRVSLLYFGLGLTFGAVMLANEGLSFAPAVWELLPAHIEFMLFGWLTQFALGIAFWILPRFSGSTPRGDERWSWAAFGLLNAGTLAAAGASWWGVAWVPLAGNILNAAGFTAFAIGNWRRIYPFANRPG